MGKVNQEKILEAEKTDIVSFCEAHGYALEKKSERYYFGVEHDSLVIDRKENKFHWNSQNISGNVISFVQTFFDQRFPEAIRMLTSKEYEKTDQIAVKPPREYVYDIEHDTSTSAVENYILNERGIDKQILSVLIKKGLIRQDRRKNCVFIWGATGKRVGSDLQGTVTMNRQSGRSTFKQISKDSKPNYGFNVSLGVPKALYFFESPIDLLSYWSLNKQLKDCRLISMNGLKHQTVMNMLKHTSVSRGTLPVNGVFLGVDNDVAGHKFVDRLSDMVLSTKEGAEITFHNLIPNDTQIPKEFISLYQDAAIAHHVDWMSIAAIHKVETNLSYTNEIANHYDYGRFFGKRLEVREKPSEIDVSQAIDTCAKELAVHMKHGQLDVKGALSDPSYDAITVSKAHTKVMNYYNAYKDLGYLPVQKPLKDWNDKVKQWRKEEGKLQQEDVEVMKPKQTKRSLHLSR